MEVPQVMPPSQPRRNDGYDMVLRFAVMPGAEAFLARRLEELLGERALQREIRRDLQPQVRLLQPVIGPEPGVWELRINLPTMAQLGEVLDWAGKPRTGQFSGDDSPDQGKGADAAPPSTLARVMATRGVEVVAEGVPLYRAWSLE
jgi:hypothetical protein